MKSNSLQLILLLAFSILFTGCDSTKYVKENQFLVKKNETRIDGKKTSDIEITSYLIQRPNSQLLGIPLGLHLYNFGSENYDSIHQNKLTDFAKRNNFWDALLSKKQTKNLIDKRKKINDWFLEKGEAPVILDPEKTNQTAQNLRTHFFNNGYFKSTVKTITINDAKKASILYKITKGNPFYIGDITHNYASASVKKTIEQHLKTLPIHKGQQYNIDNFKKTIKTITTTLRNNGYYHFSESLISFREIDTLASNNTTPVQIHIHNRKKKKGDQIIELPTEIQTIKEVNIYTDYSYNKKSLSYKTKKTYDSLSFFAHKKLKYSTKSLANSIFIKPNQIYNDKSIELTRKHLRSLNNFKSVKITHQELKNNQLSTSITLTPQKKYGINLNTEIIHSNIKQLGLSGGFSFINRNLFRGAQIFQLSLQGSIFNTSTNISGNNSELFFNAYEFGVDASLEFPRFIFPFITNIVPRTTTPKTKVTIGTSFQQNIGLDKQKLSGVVNYSWKSSFKNSHNIELLNLQFINNLNSSSYFKIFSSEFDKINNLKSLIDPDFELTTANATQFINTLPTNFKTNNPTDFATLRNITKRREIITSNNIIPATSYSFEHNSRRGISDTHYNYFKIKVSSSGNFASALFKNQDQEKKFQNIPISEFVKIDFDFRKFWSKSPNNSLAFRTFLGAAIPTGKNKDIPFITSYFAGGSNDIRAWKTYELGPGSSNSGLEFNIGNLKLISSLEYRFKVINSFHGAIFIDAGNIWNLPNATATTKKENLNNIKSLENIAIGSGLGIRYDFNFLILRLDLAFKTYEPYHKSKRWFSNYTYRESVLNIGINYPF